MFQKIFKYIILHKIIAGLAIIVITSGIYITVKKISGGKEEVRYVLSSVEKGTLTASVSGTGQVSASNQVDVKAKISGDVIFVGVKNGQEVKNGALLAQLNSKDAQKAVRDAQINLDSAKLSLEKLKKPADQLSILQSENALAQAKESKIGAEENLIKAYEDIFNSVADSFLDLPTVITKLGDMLNSYEISASEAVGSGTENDAALDNSLSVINREKIAPFQQSARNDLNVAREKYDLNFVKYKNTSRYSDKTEIEALLAETLDTTKAIAQASKSMGNYFDAWADLRSKENQPVYIKIKEYQTNLGTYVGQTSGHLSSLLSIQKTLKDSRDAILNADRSITEKTESLAKLKAGADALDVQSQEISIKQRQNALWDAQEKYTDYFVRAPFDGVIASLSVKKGDSISSGGAVATIITKQKLAEISLNEVDVAKIKIGQKANLSFDAVEGLSITGEVADMDTIGTVSQGVVTYNVKIGFDTQDERVKSGMSVSATIITDIKQDVLMVANSAVKAQGDTRYVETLDQPSSETQGVQGVTSVLPPRQLSVEVGLSNDSYTEIISGLNEGDQVITRTISTASQSSVQTAPSLFGGGNNRSGATGGAGGMMRAVH